MRDLTRDLTNALWIELRKATRSRVPPFTVIAFLLIPLAVGFILMIMRDPEYARKAGLVGTKARIMAGVADWLTFWSMLTQAMAIGGIMLFSFIGSWVFGREFADGTLKDLLALPVSRTTILMAKFIVVAIWSVALTLLVCLVGLVVGVLIGLPNGSPTVFAQGILQLLITACLVIAVLTPISFFANVGRGYLLPMGVAVLLIMAANLIVVIGWGSYFPWAVPALFAQAGGSAMQPEWVSYVLVLLTGLAGIAGTYAYWRYADQSH